MTGEREHAKSPLITERGLGIVHPMLPQSAQLTYRRIDPDDDALLAFAHYRAAAAATYGSDVRAIGLPQYVSFIWGLAT